MRWWKVTMVCELAPQHTTTSDIIISLSKFSAYNPAATTRWYSDIHSQNLWIPTWIQVISFFDACEKNFHAWTFGWSLLPWWTKNAPASEVMQCNFLPSDVHPMEFKHHRPFLILGRCCLGQASYDMGVSENGTHAIPAKCKFEGVFSVTNQGI